MSDGGKQKKAIKKWENRAFFLNLDKHNLEKYRLLLKIKKVIADYANSNKRLNKEISIHEPKH